MGSVLAFLYIVVGLLVLLGGIAVIARYVDSPRRIRHIPPEPPKADASSKELATYYRKVSSYYQKLDKPEEVRFYENLAIGYDDMKGEIP